MKDYLRKGKSLDELWAVANGNIKYSDFLGQQQGGNGQSNGKTMPPIPDDLVSRLAGFANHQQALFEMLHRCTLLQQAA